MQAFFDEVGIPQVFSLWVVQYDCNGESWCNILDFHFHSSITFSSERGLKQAINRKINRDLESGNLRRHFGTGSRVNVNVYCKELGFTEKPLATTHVNVY